METLYAGSRRGELAACGWSEEQENAFLKMQFELQNRAYKMRFPDAEYYIVEFCETPPVGRLIVRRREKEIRLVDVSLAAEFRNRGIGTRLIENLQCEAAEGGKRLTLSVLKTNRQARRLYERLGLKIVEDHDLHLVMQWRGF